MSFDAGSVLGHLGLEISEYAKGMLEAEGISELFPEVVTEFLANPLLGFADLAKEAMEAASEAIEKYGDIVKEVGLDAAMTGLAAEKAGVSVQFFSEMTAVAKNLAIPIESLGNAFTYLSRAAAEVAEGDAPKETIDAFHRLGISAAFLKENLGDPEAIFGAMRKGLDGVASQAERTRLEWALLGRGGKELIPVFNLTDDAMKGMIKTAHDLGVVETDETAKAGKSFLQLKEDVSKAWAGIEKTVSDPILDYLDKHLKEMEPMITQSSEKIRGGLKKIFAGFSEDQKKTLHTDVDDITDEFKKLGTEILKDLGVETPEKFHQKIVEIAGAVDGLAHDLERAYEWTSKLAHADLAHPSEVFKGDGRGNEPSLFGKWFGGMGDEIKGTFGGMHWHNLFHPQDGPQGVNGDGTSPPNTSARPTNNIHIDVGPLNIPQTASELASAIAPQLLKGMQQKERSLNANRIADDILRGMGGQS